MDLVDKFYGLTLYTPTMILPLFLSTLLTVCGNLEELAARVIRADCGTENGYVAAVQRFIMRYGEDDWVGDVGFICGKSVSNQRIKAWWGILGKDCTRWWIDFFKDTRSCGLYHDDDCIEVECLKFCFMPMLRDELHWAARLWNLHRMRPSTNMVSPPGRPDVLFFLPEVSGTRNYMVDVDLDELELAEGRCCYRPPQSGCSDEFTQLAEIIMREESLQFPRTPDSRELRNGSKARS